MSIAVILAGGTGLRMGQRTPKQLIDVAGRSILGRSLDAFATAPGIEEIVIVMAPGYLGEAERVASGCDRVRAVREGGATRSDSTLAALRELDDVTENTSVLFHDAARPFVDHRIIADCLSALEEAMAVAVAVPSSDTIVVADDGRVASMPPRTNLRRFQTPQGFRLGTIRRAYELAQADPDFTATDDCGVVHRYLPDVEIRLVEGSESNIKITHPQDLVLAHHLATSEQMR